MNELRSKKAHDKLIGAKFVEAISFGGTVETSVAVGRNIGSIIPARLDFDGKAVAIDKGQRADGLLIRKEARTHATQEPHVAQVFVCFANIIECQYGDPDAKP